MFVSQAQRRKFYADKTLHRHIPEFEKGTPEQLPERAGKGSLHAKLRKLVHPPKKHHRHSGPMSLK